MPTYVFIAFLPEANERDRDTFFGVIENMAVSSDKKGENVIIEEESSENDYYISFPDSHFFYFW